MILEWPLVSSEDPDYPVDVYFASLHYPLCIHYALLMYNVIVLLFPSSLFGVVRILCILSSSKLLAIVSALPLWVCLWMCLCIVTDKCGIIPSTCQPAHAEHFYIVYFYLPLSISCQSMLSSQQHWQKTLDSCLIVQLAIKTHSVSNYRACKPVVSEPWSDTNMPQTR